MHHPVIFRVPDGYDEKRLIRGLSESYRIDKAPDFLDIIAFYDTFDWRLFHRSLVLYALGDELLLRKLFDPAILLRETVPLPPGFVADLPDGELKKRLAPIVRMRTLLKMGEVSCRSAPYRISSREKKSVGRITYEEIRLSPEADGPVLGSYLWWQRAKGRPGYSGDLRNLLAEAGFIAVEKQDIFFGAVKAGGREPGDYSTRPDIPLDPGMRSDEATKSVLRFLLQVMKINEENLEKDLDTEFLHDYRVALRRTRSVLRRMKKVFPSKITARFRKDLSYVGKLSNELRDLDVHLLNEERYKAMLPASLSADIDPLFVHLREKRSRIFQGVIRNLKSKKCKLIIRDWNAFINISHQVSADAPEADIPIRELAREKIGRKYRRVLRAGNLTLENAEDEMLHRLRIHCKELRYLLEIFSGLFPRKRTHGFIGQLKNLQDMLGAFNDFSVQERYLTKVAGEIQATGKSSEKTIEAIDFLIERFDSEKRKVKDQFSHTFTEYVSPRNKKAFRETFASLRRFS